VEREGVVDVGKSEGGGGVVHSCSIRRRDGGELVAGQLAGVRARDEQQERARVRESGRQRKEEGEARVGMQQ
jgi:hypothetical protein